MESVYLKTLVEVVNAGSISKAADTLCVTQPAVSRRIKFLEEQYGYPLLDRSGAVLVTTEAGQVVYGKAKKLLEIERELLSDLKSMHERKGISFICTPTFGIVHLPAIMQQFMMEYPDLADLSFVFDPPGKIVDAMREGLYDLAVAEHCEPFDLSDFATESLPGDDMIFVSAPQLGLPVDDSFAAELSATTVLVRKEGCCSRILLEANLRKIGMELRVFKSIAVIDDLHMIVRATLNGQGISFISREVVQEHVLNGTLCEHRIAGFRHHRERTMIMPLSTACGSGTPCHWFSRAILDHFKDRPVNS